MQRSKQMGWDCWAIELVVKYGEAPSRWMTIHAKEYGTDVKPEGKWAPLMMTRLAQDTYQIEHHDFGVHRKYPCYLPDSFILMQIPESLVDLPAPHI